MDIKEKIAQANEKTVHMLMDSDPVWVDMKPAIECVDGLEDHMILHSGPPIAYEDMTMLHKRGMVSAMLLEALDRFFLVLRPALKEQARSRFPAHSTTTRSARARASLRSPSS